MRGNLVEAQPDREADIGDIQVPELVLEHDRHLVGEALAQVIGYLDPGHPGFEGDVEVMVAGQRAAARLYLSQNAADHCAQGLLHDLVIGDQAVGRIVTHHDGLGGGERPLGQAQNACADGRGRIARCLMRKGLIERDTKETRIRVAVNLDGTGEYTIATGIGFLDHMVEQFSKHSLIDVEMRVDGDLHVDQHHTTEDSAIALGQALSDALGDKAGIARYGHAYSPMDETLARVALDISGRPYCEWRAGFSQPKLGEWDTELIEHWFQSVAQAAGITLHVELLYGSNNHHICEAIYKGFARAMRSAVEIDPRKGGAIPSTKGVLGG